MRDYGIVSPKFWIGDTGKKLRGDRDAQLIALYLMTSPHATATGVFHLPILYVSHETGTPFEGASKALRRLIDEAFCTYDDAAEAIFVHRLAAYQIAEALDPKDKRISWLKKEVEKMPSELLKQSFLVLYGRAFHLVPEGWNPKPLGSPFEVPPKPGSGSGSGSGSEIRDQKEPAALNGHASKPKLKRTIPEDFILTERMREQAVDKYPDVDADEMFVQFRAHHESHGKTMTSWPAAWTTWLGNAQKFGYPKYITGGKRWE